MKRLIACALLLVSVAAFAVGPSSIQWNGTTPDQQTMMQFLNNPTFGSGTVGSLTATNIAIGTETDSGNHLINSSTAATIVSGFGTGAALTSNNNFAFQIIAGTGSPTSGVIGLPAASNGWVCNAQNVTHASTLVTLQSAGNTTQVTLTSYAPALVTPTAMSQSDVIGVRCAAY